MSLQTVGRQRRPRIGAKKPAHFRSSPRSLDRGGAGAAPGPVRPLGCSRNLSLISRRDVVREMLAEMQHKLTEVLMSPQTGRERWQRWTLEDDLRWQMRHPQGGGDGKRLDSGCLLRTELKGSAGGANVG